VAVCVAASRHRLPRLSTHAGRVTLSVWVTGLPVVELVTTGARSGEPRHARVLGIPAADGFLVVAANFGQASNPAWYHNLLAHPQASVIADRATGEYHARELSGDERERGFQLAVSLNPGWRRFKERAGPRTIPVVRLTKIAGSHP
jgi:deazaflavin-dependent oxidoreductase (nitroreductase family)